MEPFYIAIRFTSNTEFEFLEDFIYPNYATFTNKIRNAKKIKDELRNSLRFQKFLKANNLRLAIFDNCFSPSWIRSVVKSGHLENDIIKVNPYLVSYNEYTVSDYLQIKDGKLCELESMTDYDEEKCLYKYKKFRE